MGKYVVPWEDPQLVISQLRLFLMNSLLQYCQNFKIVSLVYHLTPWNPFDHYDAIDEKKWLLRSQILISTSLLFIRFYFIHFFKVEFDIDHFVLGEYRER